jgi:ABC-type Fe3+ transport system substrate-binding protein
VRDGPHPEAARRLADYLAGPEVTAALVEAGALEGVNPAEAGAATLRPDWDRLLRDLESTTAQLQKWFAR